MHQPPKDFDSKTANFHRSGQLSHGGDVRTGPDNPWQRGDHNRGLNPLEDAICNERELRGWFE